MESTGSALESTEPCSASAEPCSGADEMCPAVPGYDLPAESADDELITLWGLVVEGFTATSQRLRADLDEEIGIPLGWLDVLLRLLRTPGSRLGMSTLAAHTAITTGGFTRMADRMTEAGLVRREPCGSDRRVVWITLTPAGHELAARARVVHARHLREQVLAVLDPAAAEALAAAMRRLRDHAWGEHSARESTGELTRA